MKYNPSPVSNLQVGSNTTNLLTLSPWQLV